MLRIISKKKKKDILGMVLRCLCTPSYFWLVLGHVPSIIQNCLLNKYTLIFYHCGALGVAQEIHMQLVVWIMISPPPLPNHRTLVQWFTEACWHVRSGTVEDWFSLAMCSMGFLNFYKLYFWHFQFPINFSWNWSIHSKIIGRWKS